MLLVVAIEPILRRKSALSVVLIIRALYKLKPGKDVGNCNGFLVFQKKMEKYGSHLLKYLNRKLKNIVKADLILAGRSCRVPLNSNIFSVARLV